MKRFLHVFLAMAILLGVAQIPAAAVDTVAAETRLVNVAQGKTVTSPFTLRKSSSTVDAPVAACQTTSLVNGVINWNTSDSANNYLWYGIGGKSHTNMTDSDGAPYFILDLGRRYPVEKIVIFDGGNGSTNEYKYFNILASDDASFPAGETVTLFSAPTDISFTKGGTYTIEIANPEPYRYLKYQGRSYAGDYRFKEFQAFAQVTATEISRNASVEYVGDTPVTGKNTGTYYGPELLVDGNITKESSLLVGRGTRVPYFTVDLGADKHVGMIELYGNNYQGITKASDNQTDNCMNYTDGRFVLSGKDSQGKETTFVNFNGNAASQGDYRLPYAAYSADTADLDYRGPYGFTLSGEQTYRYIKYAKNTNASQALIIALSEFRAYELNPEVYEVTNTEEQIVIPFSDFNMDLETLKANISLCKKDDASKTNLLAQDAITLSGADAVITLDRRVMTGAGAYTLTIGKAAANTYGVTMAADVTETITLEDFAVTGGTPVITDNTGAAEVTVTNYAETDANVLVAIALYNAGGELLQVDVDIKPLTAKGGKDTFSVTAAATEAPASARVFIWKADTLMPIN